MSKIYMVCVEGRGEPRKIHGLSADAYKEAERLAAIEPNRMVRVLRIVKQYKGAVKVDEVPINSPSTTPPPLIGC